MAGIDIIAVNSWRQRRQFIDLPWTLYRGDPNWMPPLRMNQRELLNYHRHPFYDESRIQTFLARRNGEIVGRIAAIVNAEHLKRYKDDRGFFGFFECIDDQQVANALFDAARDWLRGQGMRSIRGPANPSMNYECGLLIDGFDSPPTFMMTYNPPYHARLIENYGFRKGHDLLAYIGYREQLPAVSAKLGPLAEQAQSFCEAQIRSMNTKKFREDVKLFLDLYNASLEVNWGFVPLTDRELAKLASSLRLLLIPALAVIAEVNGRGVGVILGLPDYNPRIKEIDGRIFPFGFLRLLSKKKDFKRIRVLSINVAPEFQRWGLGLVLMRGLVPKVLDINIGEAEFSWVSEDNNLARMGLEKGGAKVYKTYRMYDYEPTGDS
ncbi:MAG TPA: N-acetyltransferase [Pirellulales bacterium]|jgi:GNAT superfamily N-acetyltransferase|nr:N-acetyltransferase [Pirellulales bacterium]